MPCSHMIQAAVIFVCAFTHFLFHAMYTMLYLLLTGQAELHAFGTLKHASNAVSFLMLGFVKGWFHVGIVSLATERH